MNCRIIVKQVKKEDKRVEKREYKTVDPNGVCRYFSRVSYSLDEEMDACDVCNYYDEDGSVCRCPANYEE